MAARPGIARRKLRGHLLLACGFKLFRGAEAAVGSAVGEQHLAMFAIDVAALRLAIGAKRAADIRALVPREAEPAQGVEDLLLGGGDETGAVGVLDSEHKLAATLAGVDVVNQADVGGADVRVAGGAGSDADAYGGFGDGRTRCHRGQTLMLAERVDATGRSSSYAVTNRADRTAAASSRKASFVSSHPMQASVMLCP